MNKCIECQNIMGSQTMQKHGLGLCAAMKAKHNFDSATFERLFVDFKLDYEKTIEARLEKVVG